MQTSRVQGLEAVALQSSQERPLDLSRGMSSLNHVSRMQVKQLEMMVGDEGDDVSVDES